MPRTDKERLGNGIESWVDWEPATQDRKGGWQSSAQGKVRFRDEAGATFIAETMSRVAYDRTAERAQEAAIKRAKKLVTAIVCSIRTIRGDDDAC
jgi:hypothetical protein